MKNKNIRLFFYSLSFTLLAIIASTAYASHASDQLRMDTPKITRPAPDFTLHDLAGRTVQLSDYTGKVVLLNFWASFCAPCIEEMPSLQQLWETYGPDEFAVIGVAVDRETKPVAVEKFIEKFQLSFPIPLDPLGNVREAYEITKLPITYLINQDGQFIGRFIGERDWSSPAAHRTIKKLIQAKNNLLPPS